MLTGVYSNSLLQAVETAVAINENVSDKVSKLLLRYTGMVNKMVWRKEV